MDKHAYHPALNLVGPPGIEPGPLVLQTSAPTFQAQVPLFLLLFLPLNVGV